MKSAVIILSLVAAIVAEAPYNLPRPAAHAQQFNYPSPRVPPPPPPPPRPIPQFSPQPTPQPFNPSFGYQYQQPSIAPAFVQQAPTPQPQFQFQQQPQSQNYQHQQPQYYQQQQSQYYQQQQQQHHQQQPISYPQQQTYQPPSTSYGIPQQSQFFRGPAFQPAPQVIPQPAPQPQASQVYQPFGYNQQQQFSSQGGYSYQQPQLQPQFQQSQFQPQHIAQVPLQAQSLSQSAPVLSSYQADSNQYSNDLTHREALDSVVVDRVQNIIKDSEHTAARSAGYLSLVSGVSLENARPSVEISSFVHSSPLIGGQSSVPRGFSRDASAGISAPSTDYGLPSVSSSQSSSLSTTFLPQTKPATAYGAPN